MEEAAACLGAGRLRTVISITLPTLLPTVLTGFGLSFARALGEYGSIAFISGNLPQTEIAPSLIVQRLDQYDYTGAVARGDGVDGFFVRAAVDAKLAASAGSPNFERP